MQDDGETLYVCDGVIYRSTYYQDEKVYEIVNDAPEEVEAGPQTVFGLSLTDPMTRGDVVRDLQERLLEKGYDVGSADGVFGSATEAALQWFQYDNDLEPTGVVDAETAKLLGYEQLESGEAPQEESSATQADEPSQDVGQITEGEDVGEITSGEETGEVTTD